MRNRFILKEKLYRLKKGVGVVRVELLVCPHEGDEVLGVREVDDIVCPTGNHVNGLYLLSRYFKGYGFVRMDIALLDSCTT